MPVYDYQCPKCKTVVEKYVPTMTGDLTFLCECGTAMKKQFSGRVNVVFKGFGFPGNDRKLFSKPEGK